MSRPQPTNRPSNSQAEVARLIESAVADYRRSTEDWLRAAGKLHEARGLAPHGSWLATVADAGIPRRTAQRMIRFVEAGVEMRHMARLTHADIDRLIAAGGDLDRASPRSKKVSDWCRAVDKVREIDFPTVLSSARSETEAAECLAEFEALGAWVDRCRTGGAAAGTG